MLEWSWPQDCLSRFYSGLTDKGDTGRYDSRFLDFHYVHNLLVSPVHKKNPQGITRIIKATRYSYQGMMAALKHEAAFREEFLLCVILVPVACWLDVGKIDRILMIGSVLLILVVELLNSAIEAVVDRVGLEHNELAGRAKDMGSAAVFITLGMALFIWVAILFL